MAITKSIFGAFVEKYFAPVVRKVTESINGKTEEEQLLHTTMLTEEYSPDLKWESTEVAGSIVAADVVSLDSSLPLKKRATIKQAIGKIPKVGLKFRKDESDITAINIMQATGADEGAIAGKIMNDVPRAIGGVRHLVEVMFQKALSTGEILVGEDLTAGTGVRANFGYAAENTFHCTGGVWGSETDEPIEDIEQMFSKANDDGKRITLVMLAKSRLDMVRRSRSGKLLVANNNGQTVTNLDTLGKPTRAAMLEALGAEFGAEFRVVDSSFIVEEADGTRKAIKPWEQANVVGLTTDKVGRLVYGRVAEETNPVDGVVYEKSGSFILVSKFSDNEPLQEFTTAQAFVLPVIDGGNNVYVLHTDAEGDANFKVALTPLSFGKGAESQVIDTHYDGEGKVTASSSVAWATVRTSKDKVTVKVAANTDDAARTGKVTITDGTTSYDVTINQE
jgi:hypothetical protein